MRIAPRLPWFARRAEPRSLRSEPVRSRREVTPPQAPRGQPTRRAAEQAPDSGPKHYLHCWTRSLGALHSPKAEQAALRAPGAPEPIPPSPAQTAPWQEAPLQEVA